MVEVFVDKEEGIIFFCRNLAHVHARFQMSGELLYQPRGCNYKKVRNGSEMTPSSPEMMPETK